MNNRTGPVVLGNAMLYVVGSSVSNDTKRSNSLLYQQSKLHDWTGLYSTP